MSRNIVSILLILAIAAATFAGVMLQRVSKGTESVVSYSQFMTMVHNKDITRITIDSASSTYTFTDKNGKAYIATNPEDSNLEQYLNQSGVKVSKVSSGSTTFIAVVIILFVVILFLYFVNKRQKGIEATEIGSESAVSAKKVESAITFSDIAGNESVKQDMQFLIDFLKDPGKYHDVGARMPKGFIFYGPPGTGKTLCAKAIAGEAGVPFLSRSGSDFVEKYVGVGAKRVRELFAQARKQTPCIVFIDEIDAVGRQRGTTNNSEADQTINALLTELDGFSTMSGIVVIGATNRLDILDEALIRPGRFDRQIAISLPDHKERLEILKLHSQNKKISDNVSLDQLAKLTIGFSGAGLESLLNESAIIAVTRGKKVIDDDDIDEAYYKVVMRGNKKSAKDTADKQLELVAWHEAGHAMLGKILTKKSIPKVTIIPSTSGAGGVTFIVPDKLGLHTKQDLINDIKVNYGGRIAEYLLTGDELLTTTGASQDIKQATKLIVSMIKEFGMTDEFGMLYMDSIGKMPERTVLREAKRISKKIYTETLDLMEKNKEILEAIASGLREKETICEDELDEIISKFSIQGIGT